MNFGDLVPDFEATTTSGERFRLSEHRGRYLVLYFFPKAFTPGCTKETGLFRDAYPEISALGAEVVGISVDSHEVQCEFAKKMEVPFPMVGDDKGSIVSDYGVRWPLFKMAQRVTFIVDPSGRLAGYFHHEIKVARHAEDVLIALKRLTKT